MIVSLSRTDILLCKFSFEEPNQIYRHQQDHDHLLPTISGKVLSSSGDLGVSDVSSILLLFDYYPHHHLD
ncbi:MAG: hypothetical protein IPL98_08165 [Saprospiraceae bacterium]|nr:hypothetical protein [Saprospiraceae bacterium]